MNITDIGEDDTSSLTCATNNIFCCENLIGEWYFPNGSAVRIEGAGDAFYKNRGPSMVRLYRRFNTTVPTGTFCCVVPDTNGMNQTACILVEAIGTVTIAMSTTYLFQLRLFEVQNCLEWVVS